MCKRAIIAAFVVVVLALMPGAMAYAAGPSPQTEGWEYVVQADDWLSKLAEKYLGDAHLWPRIVAITNAGAAVDPRLALIHDSNVIYPGQIILIPASSTVPVSPVYVPPAPKPAVKPVVEPVVKSTVHVDRLDVLCQEQHPAVRAFCFEIPIARIHYNPHEESESFSCASRSGLADVPYSLNPVNVLVPNDGDFDLRGVVAAFKVTPSRTTLIPRWPGSKFDFPVDFAQKYNLPAGEQLEIPLSKAFELLKAGELIWTGRHGEPGKAGLFQTNPPLRCDPQADFEIVIGPL
jgi:LysM repeat protein